MCEVCRAYEIDDRHHLAIWTPLLLDGSGQWLLNIHLFEFDQKGHVVVSYELMKVVPTDYPSTSSGYPKSSSFAM